MKLKDILKTVIKEDTWQTWPASGGSMSPGKTPNAVSPAPTPNVKMYDVAKDFRNFENTVENEEEAASRTLENTLKQNLNNKKVVIRASKGSVGQTEQDYTINVVGVDVTYMSDTFYIIVKGNDGKDYYINPTFKIKVIGAAEAKKSAETPTSALPPKVLGSKVGGMNYPQNMGMSTNKPGAGTP